MIQRIAGGKADVNTISTALERRTNLRESFGAELQILLERTDEALGIGVVLLDDAQMAQSILTSGNQQPQIGLLAAARLTQTSLPVDLVGRLLPSKNPLLALAAERYLLAEDSNQARKHLWQHHPNQAFVTGWREEFATSDSSNFELLAKAEEKLRAELFKQDGPLEIFALIPNSEQPYSYVLRIYANKATVTYYEDKSRYRERVISQAELAAFKQFVVTAGFAELGPQFGSCHHYCWAGLWKQVAGRKAVRIGDENGAYANPIATADGKWVVLAKTDSDWGKPNYAVRFNLQTGQEFRVKIEPAEELDPIAFLPVRDRVLLRRGKSEYDLSGNRLVVDPPEYYLLEAATGETQKVTGEFAPLRQEGKRFLQPTSQTHEFWGAIPDDAKNQTRVGRYNLKDFSFKPVMVVPRISFKSGAMWVDEKRGKIYVVYKGQLLSLPLKPAATDQPR